MKILFLDDTKQKRCPRDRMGDLVGVGGVLVDSSELKNLESGLEKLARDNGFRAVKFSSGRLEEAIGCMII